MMEGLDNANIRLFSCIFICFFLSVQSTSEQEFLSIQSCATAKFTDPDTNLSYRSDESWFPDKQGCRDITNTGQENQESNKARFFHSRLDGKQCYNLPTRRDNVYSLRGLFPFTDPQTSPPGTFFSISVGVTEIAQVKPGHEQTAEGTFTATNHYTNFCLVKGRGKPYISKLELRPANLDYLKNDPSKVLKLVDRVDAGNRGAEIRYPHDLYDRIWTVGSYQDATPSNTFYSPANINITDGNNILPPIEVLRTAVAHEEKLEFVYRNLGAVNYEHRLFLYFLELNDSVRADQRVFDIYINGENKQEVDILAGGSRHHIVVLNFTANGFLNLTLVKASNSQMGPICNAYELFQEIPRNQETATEEVNVMANIKNELSEHNQDSEVLETWSGDPCLPLPWYGLSCEHRSAALVITKMDLSFRTLAGPIPPSITKLIHLKELNLSNNKFAGSIPVFPASSVLTSVDLSHNDLDVDDMDSLVLLPSLTTLYFGCNSHVSKNLTSNLSRSNLTTDKGICHTGGSSQSARGVIIGVVAGGSLLVTVAVGISLFCLYKQKQIALQTLDVKGHTMSKNAIYSVPSTDEVEMKSISIQSFTLQCIETATEKYKILIGEGGFGSVYRGTLPDGQEVAVKVRSATSTQGTREFDNELTLLSAIRHENLVPLLGYCCENDQQILVYPFMSNGSLQDRLYGEAAKRKVLDWPTRLSIALGAARGLTYLHTFSERCVIHRDVKSSNILLDNSMTAKVADFGFSKYAPQEGDSGTSLEVRGTAGYLDPEYYSTQHLSAKSDVFSFGVVLLEIVSGREPLNINRPRQEWSLVEWAKPHIRNSRIEEIVDPNIKGGYHAEAMWRVVEVALACIEPYSVYRPCMADIVRELEDAFIIENNASEYMRSIESFGGSNRYSIERPMVIPPTPVPTEPSPILMQPPPPQPR